ncbi:hypothetical protein WG66_000980 [Moniliophthora roreri]|nr:hypothetical protein WG66_000980 [Moniliophthora roreri]
MVSSFLRDSDVRIETTAVSNFRPTLLPSLRLRYYTLHPGTFTMSIVIQGQPTLAPLTSCQPYKSTSSTKLTSPS